MGILSQLKNKGIYETFDEEEVNDKEFLMSLIGTPVRHEYESEFVKSYEYGFIMDTWWSQGMDAVDCKVALFSEDGEPHGKFTYLLTSLEKCVGEKGNSRVYRIVDESGNFCSGGRSRRTIWTRKGDAERHCWEENEVVAFKLVREVK